jgi:hypothetical protein
MVHRQDVNFAITDQSVHDAIGPNDDFTDVRVLEFWDRST